MKNLARDWPWSDRSSLDRTKGSDSCLSSLFSPAMLSCRKRKSGERAGGKIVTFFIEAGKEQKYFLIAPQHRTGTLNIELGTFCLKLAAATGRCQKHVYYFK